MCKTCKAHNPGKDKKATTKKAATKKTTTKAKKK
jgi:hypothetical protein